LFAPCGTSDKPWFTEDCKELDRQYQQALYVFNKNRNEENGFQLNIAKQKYKVTENKLKRQYKNQQGNMLVVLPVKMYSFIILSVPTDLFFFKAFTHLSNSSSVNVTSNSLKMF
jgi:hypothetical protein